MAFKGPFRGVGSHHGRCYRCGENPPLYMWRYPNDPERKNALCPECWDWANEAWQSDPTPLGYTRIVMQMLRTHTQWRQK